LIKERLRNINRKLKKKEETLGGWLMSWTQVRRKKQKEKLLK
jgi:hypothetical protein